MHNTKVALVIDESASMGNITNPVKDLIKSTINNLKLKSHEIPTDFSLIKFANNAYVHISNIDVNTPVKVDYNPNGMTALYDGVLLGIETLKKAKADKDTNYLLLVITDGEENCSKYTNAVKVFTEMIKLAKTDKWTFTFQVPTEWAKQTLVRAGISTDNIRVWENTRIGTVDASLAIGAGLNDFYCNTSQGIKSSKTFYNVTTDLSAINRSDIGKLQNVTNELRIMSVTQEISIRDFISQKGMTYNVGSCYYQLSKDEKVQQNKNIILYDKASKKYMSGKRVRDLIGLPYDGDAKVKIGNHANYDIFVQSTSVNRKLVRGTRLLLNRS